MKTTLLTIGILIVTYFTTAQTVGTLSGNLSVSSSGAATYSLPIDLPQGRSGMTPELSLVYNSQSDDGILGRGWSIHGWEYIERVSETQYYDQINDCVDFDGNDGFFLNGNRLINLGENSNSVEYRTEIDQVARIIRYGAQKSPSDISYFVVESKEGLYYYYGETPSSKQVYGVEINPAIRYNLSKVIDRNGNYIKYFYNRDISTGELYINEIKYTGYSNIEPYYTVKFNYVNNQSQFSRTSFFNNDQNEYNYQVSKLLKSIEIKFNNENLRKYEIEYSNNGLLDKPYLNKITLVGSSNNSLKSTTFNWEFLNSNSTEPQKIIEDPESIPILNPPNTVTYISGDFDGDGLTDIIESGYVGDNYGNTVWTGTYLRIKGDLGNKIFISSLYSTDVYSGDFNGDGKDDLILENRVYEINLNYSLRLVCVLPTNIKIKRLGDFNGDNLIDVTLKEGSSYYLYFGSSYIDDMFLTSNKKVITNFTLIDNDNTISKIGNFIGNGVSTFCNLDENHNIRIYQLNENGGQYELQVITNQNNIVLSLEQVHSFDAGDFNGDGKDDLIISKTDIIAQEMVTSIYYSYGGGFKSGYTVNLDNYYEKYFSVLDLNNDGLSDVFVYSPVYQYHNNRFEITLSINKFYKLSGISAGFKRVDETKIIVNPAVGNFPTWNRAEYYKFLVGDFNRTGVPDLFISYYQLIDNLGEMDSISIDSDNKKLTLCSIINRGYLINDNTWSIGSDRINSIYDSYNRCQIIKYKKYTPELSDVYLYYSYPLMSYKAPLYVVNRILIDYGKSLIEQVYNYKKLIFEATGKGLIGFLETTVDDNFSGISTTTLNYVNYSNWFLYPKLIQKRTVNSYIIMSEITNNYDVKLTNESISNLIFIPVNTLSVNKNWDIDKYHTYLGCSIKVQDINDIDTYGNSKKYTIIKDENAVEYIPENTYNWKTTTTSEYYPPNIDKWLVGLLKSTTTEKYHVEEPDIPPTYLNKTEYNYFETTDKLHLLEYKTDIPNGSERLTTQTWYDYDKYGNAVNTKITAPNDNTLSDRIVEYEYDENNNNLGRFLTKTTIRANADNYCDGDQITVKKYNLKTGNMVEIISPNGKISTSYKYDEFGKLTLTTYPDKTSEETIYSWSNGDLDAPNYSVYKIESHKNLYNSQDKWKNSKIFFDRLQRPIRKVSIDMNGLKIYKDSEYNFKGQLLRVSEPYYSTNKPKQWTTYTYDEIGRVILMTLPSGSEISTLYSGRKTYVVDKKTNVWKETTVNSIGKIDIVKDPTDGMINFNYDAEERTVGVYAQWLTTKMRYDDAGNQILIDDPDAGPTTSEYNAFGQLKYQTDAKNNKYEMSYDNQGRIVTKSLIDKKQITTFYYFESRNDNGFGLVRSIIKNDNDVETSVYYTYDSLDRIQTKTNIVDDVEYTFEYSYNKSYGLLETYTYPSKYKIKYCYDKYGYLNKIVDETNKPLWTATLRNVRGQLTNIKFGNGLTTTKVFDEYGFPFQISTSNNTQNLFYIFQRHTGNLISKWEYVNGIWKMEKYQYDKELNNRLTEWDNFKKYEIKYDYKGNIITKTGITEEDGGYSYNSYSQPHAVKSITNPTAEYVKMSPNQDITYNEFNKVKSISQVLSDVPFVLDYIYGPDNKKIKTVYYNGNTQQVIKTKYFFDDYEVEINQEKSVKQLHYISSSDDGLFGIYEKNSSSMYYIHKDYLGSYNVITNNSGNIVQTLSFDPWGRQRNPITWDYNEIPKNIFDRGFTGHQYLENYGLIDMGGRLYDPVIARFLSPDPFVQAPDNSQNYNGYSYALNNPLKYTDPTGEWLHLVIGGLAGGLINWGINGFQWNIQGLEYFGVGALAGFLSAGVGAGVGASLSGGSFSAGFWGTSAVTASGFGAGFSIGLSTGATNGFITGSGNKLIQGGNLIESIGSGIQQCVIQGTSGAIIGGIIGGVTSVSKGNDFWTGESKFIKPSPPTVSRMTINNPRQQIEISVENMKSTPKPIYTDSDLYFDVKSKKLEWCDFYSDGSSTVRETWVARSGSSNYRRLPDGYYKGTNLRGIADRDFPSSMWRDNVAFSLDLNDAWDNSLNRWRTLLRVHPDGNYYGNWWLNDGTAGCIGLQSNATQLNSFFTRTNTYLNRVSNFINIIVY